MPKNVTKSPTVEKLQETKDNSPYKANSQFFYREWRDLNKEHDLFAVWETPHDILLGQIIGFVNFEHAIIQTTHPSEKIVVLDITLPDISLFQTLELAVDYKIHLKHNHEQ